MHDGLDERSGKKSNERSDEGLVVILGERFYEWLGERLGERLVSRWVKGW